MLTLKNLLTSSFSLIAFQTITGFDLYIMIKEFRDLTHKGSVRKRTKRKSSDSYFYLARQLENCMMRNLHGLVLIHNKST